MEKCMVKASEVAGGALNWAVSTCLGNKPMKDVLCGGIDYPGWWETLLPTPNRYRRIPDYSLDDRLAGQFISGERMNIKWDSDVCTASTADGFSQSGPTLCVAVMRCKASICLGEEFEVPAEMVQAIALKKPLSGMGM
jgi:hypothetical protein